MLIAFPGVHKQRMSCFRVENELLRNLSVPETSSHYIIGPTVRGHVLPDLRHLVLTLFVPLLHDEQQLEAQARLNLEHWSICPKMTPLKICAPTSWAPRTCKASYCTITANHARRRGRLHRCSVCSAWPPVSSPHFFSSHEFPPAGKIATLGEKTLLIKCLMVPRAKAKKKKTLSGEIRTRVCETGVIKTGQEEVEDAEQPSNLPVRER